MMLETTVTAAGTVPFEERRRSVRRPTVCEAWVRSPTDDDDTKIEVTALDLSRHGVGFESRQPLAVNCFYWIELEIGDKEIAQEIRVTSCNESEEIPGVYRVGGKFC